MSAAPTPLRTRLEKADVAKPAISATPYAWRDPETLPPRPWLFGRWLLRGTAAAVIAPGGIGKTTTLDTIALSIVTGRPLVGKTVWDGAGRVWLWNLEDDMDERARSIQAAAKHHGVTAADLDGRLFVDSAMDGAGLCTTIEDAAGFRLIAPVYEQITAELIDRGIDTLIIDPFVSSHDAEENDNNKMDKIVKAWGKVAKAADASVILVHHTSRAGAAEVTATSARGAIALVYACRSALVLNRMTDEEANGFGIREDDERRRYFTVQDDKHNRAPPEKADWFRLASVPLGNGKEGGDSIGVAERWTPPDAFEGVSEDHLRRVQLAVAAGEYKAHHSADDWVGNAVATVFGLDVKDKADRARMMKMLDAWLSNGLLKTEERKDRNRQLKKFVVVGRSVDDHSATPRTGVASRGVAAEQPGATLHPTPCRGVGVADVADRAAQVSQGQASQRRGSGSIPAGKQRGPILAPGESYDDPVPRWEE